MKDKMTLEEYKKKIEEYLINSKIENHLIENWMQIYEDDIFKAYNEKWSIENIAIPIIMGY